MGYVFIYAYSYDDQPKSKEFSIFPESVSTSGYPIFTVSLCGILKRKFTPRKFPVNVQSDFQHSCSC